MATTGELCAIIEELELVDIGDAASYLGEEVTVVEESLVSQQAANFGNIEPVMADDGFCYRVR